MKRFAFALISILALSSWAQAQCPQCAGPKLIVIGSSRPFCGCAVTGVCTCLPGQCQCPACPATRQATARPVLPQTVARPLPAGPRVMVLPPTVVLGGCPGGRCR